MEETSIPLLMRNKMPEVDGYENDEKLDIAMRPEGVRHRSRSLAKYHGVVIVMIILIIIIVCNNNNNDNNNLIIFNNDVGYDLMPGK